MKFDCGETFHEKVVRVGNWHPWFAWYPVRVDTHDCRWFEIVERKMTLDYGGWYRAYRAKTS